jgi:hypothetical protein
MSAEPDNPVIPMETQMRMALIQERHLSNEYAYMKSIVSSHEREIAVLSAAVVILLIVDYCLIVRLVKVERTTNE